MKPYLVGLTGGMAEGKTTCCRFFEELGAVTLDVDSIVHSMYEEGTILKKIKNMLLLKNKEIY
jgi:dephospho-CoA kinase